MDSARGDDFIYETQYWRIVLNANQTYLGRCVIILKRPCGDLAEITESEILDFFTIVKLIEVVYRELFSATMFNWSCLMNNAYRTSPPTPQAHWHLLPRYDHPVVFAGETFVDPNFGNRALTDARAINPDISYKLIETIRLKMAETAS